MPSLRGAGQCVICGTCMSCWPRNAALPGMACQEIDTPTHSHKFARQIRPAYDFLPHRARSAAWPGLARCEIIAEEASPGELSTHAGPIVSNGDRRSWYGQARFDRRNNRPVAGIKPQAGLEIAPIKEIACRATRVYRGALMCNGVARLFRSSELFKNNGVVRQKCIYTAGAK